MTARDRVALGLAPHSGWAALVGIAHDREEPRLVARERIEMTDPAEPESKQPYHTAEGMTVPQATRLLGRYEATAGRLAHEAIARVVRELGEAGHPVVGVGILDSAGRKGGSLEATLSSHALIHTADGDHFRNAIASAAEKCGLPSTRVRARDLEGEAASATGRKPQALAEVLRTLGREAGPPWTADQKSAALLAWLLLAKEGPRARAART